MLSLNYMHLLGYASSGTCIFCSALIYINFFVIYFLIQELLVGRIHFLEISFNFFFFYSLLNVDIHYTLQIVIISYSSNINKLLISLIKIDGCYNLKYFLFHWFHYSFYQILLSLHPAFHREVSQPVCKPSQITEFCVIPMMQEISNCGKY